MARVLKHYLKRLTNLSGRNRSLILLRLIKDHFIDVHAFDYSMNQPSFEIIKHLIAKKKYALCENVDPRDAQTNTLSRQLRRLKRNEDYIFEERGARDLYVGWPFVEGRLQDDTLIRCPLIYFPIEITQEKKHWYLQLKEDVNITLNKTFLLAYAYYNESNYDEELVDTNIGDFDSDENVFRTQLYELLKGSFLEINFNQELFLDKLVPFKELKKESYLRKTNTGKLKFENTAVLGIFPQAGSHLVPDYVHLQEDESFQDLESFFADKTQSNSKETKRIAYSDRVLEENTYTPFELDAYQEEALKRIKQGESLTVQGPPGSGKSQLIANLISDFVARGKHVLLICQKKAALDVVYSRLKSQDLHDFTARVHDFKNDRKDVFDKIESQIDRLEEYKRRNNGLDTIALERDFTQASRQIEQITEELEEYKEALFDTATCGKSAKELYLTSDPTKGTIELKSSLPELHYEKVPSFKEKMSRYFEYFFEYDNKNHFWAHERSFADYSSGDLVKIRKMLDDVFDTFQSFKKSSSKLLHKELDYDATDFFVNNKKQLDQLISNIDQETTYDFFTHLLEQKPDESNQWLVDQERIVLQSFKGVGMESSLTANELGRFQEALQNAIKARKNPLSYLKWRLFSKEQIFISRVLVANGLKGNKQGFEVLLDRIDNRLNFEHNLSLIQKKEWLKSFPSSHRKIDIQNWFFHSRLAFKSLELYLNLRHLEAFVSFKSTNRKEQVALLKDFSELIEIFPQHKEAWNKYLTNHQIRELLSDRVQLKTALGELTRDFDNLQDFHSLKASFTLSQKKVIEELEEHDGDVKSKLALFDNSLALTWIDHLETKFPVLRMVSSKKYQQLVSSLTEAIEQKSANSREILLLRSRERTFEDIEYNRLQNRVTYRDLHHQVKKKKQIWPLRKVISTFKEEIFQLIPCWMASPETASAVFPMQEMFDLVIFDEASQCFAERGIPGMYRGKQVVVVGDSQQLQPFDLYRARWDTGDDEGVDLETEALLDLSSHYLPSVALQGHYRSESLELIAFSNEHFYKNKLQMIPKFQPESKETPIEVVKVNGKWENNVNQIEAEEVIRQIQLLHSKDPHMSIGVATFNAPQQDLIADLLDQKLGSLAGNTDLLFIKNIENVQGDERDAIIFSTAYAKDKKGTLQLKFGSLNQAGGENRLNVAATRARKKIILVTSLRSKDIKAENTKNPGPKLFAAYLEYAESISKKTWKPQPKGNNLHGHSWYLSHRVQNEFEIDKRFQLMPLLPFADLTVMDEQTKSVVGLILTDDALYHDALSVKDSYVYTPQHFKKQHWPTFQADSRQLWLTPQDLGDRLRLFIHRLSQGI